MATQKAIAANAKKNNGATVLWGGNVDTSAGPVTRANGLSEVGFDSGKYGSAVTNPISDAQIAANKAGDAPGANPARTRSATYKPLSSGNFAKMLAEKFILRTLTTELAGVANTILQVAASDYGRVSIHKIQPLRNTRLASWSYAKPAGSDGPLVYTATKIETTTALSADHAATPTRGVPGELVYRDGSKTPFQADYEAKHG